MIESNLVHVPTVTDGCYTFGSGPTVVLILGSCRIMPYANYFEYLNQGNRYTVHVIDVVRFNFTADQQRADVPAGLARFEAHAGLLAKLKSVRWFIHEHTVNYGMFNTERSAAKNIYQFGISPEVDVAIPNFNNHFILFQDYVSMDKAINEEAKACGGKLSADLQARIRNRGLDDVDKFCRLATLTDLPEVGAVFADNWKKVRYFWNVNHITKAFTQLVFGTMNAKFLQIPLTPGIPKGIMDMPDMYESPHTSLTPYDVECYGIDWGEPVVPLKV